MEVKEAKENKGQLPEFVKMNTGYFFSIRVEGDAIQYETRWAPNTDILIMIADHFDLEFTHEFDEPMMMIYGKSEYRNKCISVIELDSDDTDLYEYDEEKDCWIFEGKSYESDYEIKEILLERKVKES